MLTPSLFLIFGTGFATMFPLVTSSSRGVICLTILLIIILVISSIGVIATVLLQSGRSAGLSGAISGAGESIFGKKKGLDELLAKFSFGFAALYLLSNLAMAILHK